MLVVYIITVNLVLGNVSSINCRLKSKKTGFLDPSNILLAKINRSCALASLESSFYTLKNLKLLKKLFISSCSLGCSVNCSLNDPR